MVLLFSRFITQIACGLGVKLATDRFLCGDDRRIRDEEARQRAVSVSERRGVASPLRALEVFLADAGNRWRGGCARGGLLLVTKEYASVRDAKLTRATEMKWARV